MAKYNTFCYGLFLVVLLLSLFGCNRGKEKDYYGKIGENQMQYAKLITMSRADSFVLCELKNPWNQAELLNRYILVPKNRKLPQNRPEGIVIRTPIESSILFSSVHMALWKELNVLDKVAGVCDTAFIVSNSLRNALKRGHIPYAGSSMNPNIETLIKLRPTALFISPYEGMRFDMLRKVGVPIIECADYMEYSPLSRAEWMKFYGELLGKRTLADSIFYQVEQSYNSLVKSVKDVSYKPTLLADIMQSNHWFVPGGNSTIGKLFSDAGANYIYKHTEESGSLAYNAEKVLKDAMTADFWLIKYGANVDFTYSSLGSENVVYTKFAAYKNRNIWHCNVSYSSYFEETSFHPERALKDLIYILHPSKFPGYTPIYYRKMSEL